MSEYLIQGETLTGIADAIRGKTGGTEPVAVSDMAAQIEGIPVGGDEVLTQLIGRTIVEVSNDATHIGDYAFYACGYLTTINFPNAKEIHNYAFGQCDSLTEIYFPNLTYVSTYAFVGCSLLSKVNLPLCKTISEYAFSACAMLETVNIPNATKIGTYAFKGCSALSEIDLPSVSTLDGYAFYECASLIKVLLPLVATINTNTFNKCTALNTVDLPSATKILGTAFSGCTTLRSVILRSGQVASLGSTTAFNNTPIKSGTGYIYVPAALIEDYKAATNWSTYAAQFRALEDYTVDGTTTGELDPAKTGT